MTGLSKVSQLSNLFINKSRINTSSDSFAHALNKKKNKYFLSAKTSSKLEKIANDKFGVEFKTIERSGLMKVLFERPQNVDVKDYNVRVSKFISYLEDCKTPRLQTLTQSRLSQIIADGEAYLECVNGEREQAHTQAQEKEQKQIDSFKKRIHVSLDYLLSALRIKEDNDTPSRPDKTLTKIDQILERDFHISCKKIHKILGDEGVRLPRTRKDDEHDKNVSILIEHLDSYINNLAESDITKGPLSKIKENAQDYLDKVNNAIVARQIKDETLATLKRKARSENINSQNEPLTGQGSEAAQGQASASNSSKIPLDPGYVSIPRAHIISEKQILVDRLKRESEENKTVSVEEPHHV